MSKILPEKVEIIGTHPLFGPQSGRAGIAGMRVAFCPVRTTRAEQIKRFFIGRFKIEDF